MPYQDFTDLPAAPDIRFALEPANNAFESIRLLSKEYEQPGVSGWVEETARLMTQAERETNLLVTMGLHYASLPQPGWSSFPEYLRGLEASDPLVLRDRMMREYEAQPLLPGSGTPITPRQALESADRYLAYLRQHFWPDHVDEALERTAFRYASDPPAMKRLIIEHLSSMWHRYLAAEWERVQPLLLESIRAFQQVDFRGKSLAEAANLVAGRDLPPDKWKETFQAAKRILFVPNAHIGPYVFRACVDKEAPVILFGARLPNNSTVDAPDLSRAEVVMQLGALADETRLRILRLAADRGELRSQEIMEALNLSQPATSRHLSQLAATGYLKERRCDGAKCYSLNIERINDTFQALSNFLLMGEGVGRSTPALTR